MYRDTGSLFVPNEAKEQEIRQPERPLGHVSDYVVEVMPMMLADIRAGGNINALKRDAKLLAHDALRMFDDVAGDTHTSELAALDLKMLESGLVHAQPDGLILPPVMLGAAVDQYSTHVGQIPGLTYEEVILINPPHDRRRFTDGAIGGSEDDFYEGHRQIEQRLDTAITNGLRANIAMIGSGDTDAAAEFLANTAANAEQVAAFMKQFKQMDKDHFGQFRGYFATHPTRHLKGPSGAFSARVPILDLVVAGDHTLPVYGSYLTNNMQYFPRGNRKQLAAAQQLAERGLTVSAVNDKLGHDPQVASAVATVYDSLDVFRAKHAAAVQHHVPAAMAGKAPGTGGEQDVRTFLLNRHRSSRQMSSRKGK